MGNAKSAKGNPASKRMQNVKLKAKRIANKARNEAIKGYKSLRAMKGSKVRSRNGIKIIN